MIYQPRTTDPSAPLPYGGSREEWPHGRESTAWIFSDDGDGFWGFFDPEWKDDDGTVRGQLRINIASPSGHGGTGSDRQTQTFWANADDPKQIADRILGALRFAAQEAVRGERIRIAQNLLADD